MSSLVCQSQVTYDLPSKASIVLFVKLVGMGSHQLESIITVEGLDFFLDGTGRDICDGPSLSPGELHVLLITDGSLRRRCNLSHGG